MAEDLIIASGSKEEQYQTLTPQIKSLIEGENDFVANMANFVAALKTQFNFYWVGFYLIKDNELVLGPFQGPVACTRIQKGRGVCGTAWDQEKTILVPDVNQFPGHIACSSFSKSEIVIPFYKDEELVGVLDVDSDRFDDFDEIDVQYLENLLKIF